MRSVEVTSIKFRDRSHSHGQTASIISFHAGELEARGAREPSKNRRSSTHTTILSLPVFQGHCIMLATSRPGASSLFCRRENLLALLSLQRNQNSVDSLKLGMWLIMLSRSYELYHPRSNYSCTYKASPRILTRLTPKILPVA